MLLLSLLVGGDQVVCFLREQCLVIRVYSIFCFVSCQEAEAKEFFTLPWVARAECDNGSLGPTWRLSNLALWLQGWWISKRQVKGVGQIGFFSWLLAILVLIFFVGVHFCSNDLNNKNERSLGKERVIDAQEGLWWDQRVFSPSTLVPRCLFHWFMLNFALHLPLAQLVYSRTLKWAQHPLILQIHFSSCALESLSFDVTMCCFLPRALQG